MTNVYVDPTAIIDNGVSIGSGTKVWHYVHIMEDAQIGKECVIADYVYVGRGVKIGNNVKVENRATVYEGVTIEDKVFVGPHVTFTNDLDKLRSECTISVTKAEVAELADALRSGRSGLHAHVGSTPTFGIRKGWTFMSGLFVRCNDYQ